MNKEQILQEYTDLTWQRYECLNRASCGTLKLMNGPMHKAMAELIDTNFQATEWGEEVLKRGRAIMDGAWEPVHRKVLQKPPVTAAAALRKTTKYVWIRSVHAKLLVNIYAYPWQAYRHLAKIYGYAPLHKLLDCGLLVGERRMGAQIDAGEAGFIALAGAKIMACGFQEILNG